MVQTSFPWFFWLFPVAFALHNIEEALWLPAWSQSAGRFHRPVGAFEFRFALLILTLISIVITYLFSLRGAQSWAAYLYFAFNFGMFVNVFLPHVAATIALRKYCPGTLTGLFLLAPTTLILLLRGYAEAFFLFPTFWFVTIPFAIAIVGSIPLLFKAGKMIGGLWTT